MTNSFIELEECISRSENPNSNAARQLTIRTITTVQEDKLQKPPTL